MNIKRQIFEYIVDQGAWGTTPLREDVRKHFAEVASDIDLHLAQLEREGLLRISDDTGAVSLVPTYGILPPIPLCYNRFANPIAQQSQPDSGSINLDLRGIGIVHEANSYAMQVLDDSMSDSGIYTGDIALLCSRPLTRGDIVAVELNGRMVLRRYLRIRQIPHILAENPRNPDLQPAFEIATHGVLWGLIRREVGRRPVSSAARRTYSYSQDAFITRAAAPMPHQGMIPMDLECDETRLPKSGKKGRCHADRSSRRRTSKAAAVKKLPRGCVLPKRPPQVGLNEQQCAVYRVAG